MADQPTASQVHIDVGLTEVSQRVKNTDLIGEKLFPVISVKKDSDLIWIYGKEALAPEDDSYIPGDDAAEGGWSVSTSAAYALLPYRKKAKIVWENRDNADEPIKYEQDAVTYEREKMLLSLEKRIAAKVLNASLYGANTDAAAVKWDAVDSDPLMDVEAARDAIHKSVLLEANTLVLPRKVYNILRVHPKLIEMYKYVVGGKLSIEQLKELFEVENILVGKAGELVTPEVGDPVMTPVWTPSKVMLAFVAPAPGLQQVSFGYVYRKSAYPYVEKYTDVPKHTDNVYLNDKYDIKIQAQDAGFLLTNVI